MRHLMLIVVLLAGCVSVDRGEKLFLAETFSGNGRTCSSCHKPAESFSISPRTIQSLPPGDPLFVPIPGLEDPVKLRADGLVFVNDPDDGIIEFRQTPKLVHLRRLCSSRGACGPLGLRGDRERDLCKFSNEAIANHLTRRVPGVPGEDFRFLTPGECRDLVVYLVSRRVADSGSAGN